MKKTLLTLATLLLASLPLRLAAQSDPVVIEVGGQEIRQSEFIHNFMESVGNKLLATPNVTAQEKRQALDEYVELYANFRAKVLDARAMGLDTTPSLLKELAQYRKELATPYLIDSAMFTRIMREAYERNRYALHAAHILVKVAPDASPKDTAQAYGRALFLQRRALDGENFFDLAHEQVLRDNPKAEPNSYEGELAYFSTFSMVYPFENAAYALQPGQISMPIRSRYGYHVIKLIDRAEIYGKVTFQHIWLRNPQSQGAIALAYEQLQQGTPFEIVARTSDDRSTSETGGYIVDASIGQLPHEYVKMLSTLQPGEVSSPFLTRYGWHIIRLIKKDTLPPFQSMIPYYRQKLARDPRGADSRKSFAVSARKKYGIVDFTTTPVPQTKKKGRKKQPEVMMASLDEMISLMNDSIFRDLWRFKKDSIHDLRPLVHTPSQDYTNLNFARFIRRNQYPSRPEPYDKVVHRYYERFLDSVTIAYADSQIEIENPDFAALVDDYRNGLMIFDYNDKMIWSKAIYDTVGFADFYARESRTKRMDRPDDSIFFWRTRARVTYFDVADAACLDASKAQKVVQKAVKKNKSSLQIKQDLLDKVSAKKCNVSDPVTHAIEVVEQGRQQLLTPEQWQPGVYCVAQSKGYRILVVEEVMPPMLKEQMEARGYYLNAWQNEVEQDLMKELRSKYNVSINYDAVRKIDF